MADEKAQLAMPAQPAFQPQPAQVAQPVPPPVGPPPPAYYVPAQGTPVVYPVGYPMQPSFPSYPVDMTCPSCQSAIRTRTTYELGLLAWGSAGFLLITTCIFAPIPLCISGLKDVRHECPNCNRVLGVHKRIAI